MLKLSRLSKHVKNIPGHPDLFEEVQSPEPVGPEHILSTPPIDFNDNVWDMREVINDSEGSHTRIDFDYYLKGVEDLEVQVKVSALYYWKDPHKFSPVKQYVRNITLVLAAVRKYSMQMDYHKVTAQMVIYAINKHTKSPDNRRHLLSASIHFYETVLEHYPSELFLMKVENLEKEQSKYKVSKGRKTHDFDDGYFQTIISSADSVIHDTSIKVDLRKAAAVVMIEAWTGLRRNEIFNLRKDCLSNTESVYGINVTILNYNSKKVYGYDHSRFKTVCFPEAVEAVKVLVSLQGEVESDFLLPNHKNPSRVDSRARLEYWINMFFYLYVPECLSPKKGIESYDFKYRYNASTVIYRPTPTNFRVHLCGVLYRNHVALPIIELGMSHLTETMIAYYYRDRVEDRVKAFTKTEFVFTLLDRNYDFSKDEHLNNLLLNMHKMDIITERYDNCTQEEALKQRSILRKLADEIIENTLNPCLQIVKIIGRRKIAEAFPEIKTILEEEKIEKMIGLWTNKL